MSTRVPPVTESTGTRRLAALVVAAGTVGLVWPDLLGGWYPHDEGAIGQAAERILHGDVPHRDFDEIYTGLLSYVHAAVFHVAGVSAANLRLLLAGATLGWSIVTFRLALRTLPTWWAAALALVCVLWSVPNYPASLPSWYLLFVATAIAEVIIRWTESGQARWLVLAGGLGGLALLIKLTGLLLVAGGALALVALRTPAAGPTRRYSAALALAAMSAVALLALAGPLFAAGPREVLRFWLPSAAIATALVVREWRGGAALGQRFRVIGADLIPYIAGFAIVVCCWLLVLVAQNAVTATWAGVFVTPFRRIGSAAMRPPGTAALFGTAVLALALVPPWSRGGARVLALLVGGLGSVLIVWSGTRYWAYRELWQTAWGIPMLVAGWGAFRIARARGLHDRPSGDPAIVLGCLTLAALFVEFPFAAPIYTLYVLPLALVTLFALAAPAGSPARPPRPVAAAYLVILILFAVLRLYPSDTGSLGYRFHPSRDTVPLGVSRAPLRVPRDDAAQYSALVQLLDSLPASQVLFAAPDAPEVYFLSGRANHTRTLFDFLSADAGRDVYSRAQDVNPDIVVLRRTPSFSAAATPDDVMRFRAAFPHERQIGGFTVLWR